MDWPFVEFSGPFFPKLTSNGSAQPMPVCVENGDQGPWGKRGRYFTIQMSHNLTVEKFREASMMLAFLRKPFMAPVWLIVRVLVGWQWLTAGWEKVANPAPWFGAQAGAAVAGMVNGAVKMTTGAHANVLGAPAAIAHAIVIPTAGFWGAVVPFAEILVGLGIIFGGLTGTALLGALVMNLVYMLMGSDGVNPVMFVFEAILFAVGPAAALWGLDNVLFHNWRNRRLVFHPAPSGDHPETQGPRAA